MRPTRSKADLGRSSRLGSILLTVAVALLKPGEADAADLDFRASVDRNRIEVGERLTLTVSISSEGLKSAPTPELDAPEGFDVLNRTSSSSTSISIVNGEMTTTKDVAFVYTLEAVRAGSFLIGPARMTHQGKVYKTSAIRVEVAKKTGGGQPRPKPRPGKRPRGTEDRDIEANLFIRPETNKGRVYVGEQLNLSYTLYTKYNLQNVSYSRNPTFTGFWAEALYDAQRLDLKREIVEGQAYNTLLLKRVALFPTTFGRQKLEQLEVVCDVPVRSHRRSLFDFDDFFDFNPFQVRQVALRSAPLEVEVLPLPAGAPPGFSGAVGQFRIVAEATPGTIAAGEPVSLKVTLSGHGNLNALSDPERPDVAGLRFYDPKVAIHKETNGGRFRGRKLFDYVVIPEAAGPVRIGPFRLSYFDPDQRQFVTIESRPVDLIVKPGRVPDPAAMAPLLSKEEIRLLGEDVRYIKPDVTVLEDRGGPLYGDRRFLALQVLPVLALASVLVYKRHRERILGDLAYARRRRSRSEAKRRLSEAGRLLRDGEDDAFYAEVYRALTQFLADRLDLAPSEILAASSDKILAARDVPTDLAVRVKAVLHQCDVARFSPAQVSNGGMKQLFEQTRELIEALGKVT